MSFHPTPESEPMVDALESGCIVRVTEAYARNEGLTVLRRMPLQTNEEKMASIAQTQRVERTRLAPFEALRKPLRRDKNNVLGSLIEGFHWQISKRRRERNLTRKNVAQAIGVGEQELKMVENGILPADDFVIISKLEKYFSLNLRKDGGRHDAPASTSLRPALRAREMNSNSSISSKSIGESVKEVDQDSLLGVDDLIADEIDLDK